LIAPGRESRDMVVDVIRTIARHGPKRFYVLNTRVSTQHALEPGELSCALP
jgi:creatinine amidohydrolase